MTPDAAMLGAGMLGAGMLGAGMLGAAGAAPGDAGEVPPAGDGWAAAGGAVWPGAPLAVLAVVSPGAAPGAAPAGWPAPGAAVVAPAPVVPWRT